MNRAGAAILNTLLKEEQGFFTGPKDIIHASNRK